MNNSSVQSPCLSPSILITATLCAYIPNTACSKLLFPKMSHSNDSSNLSQNNLRLRFRLFIYDSHLLSPLPGTPENTQAVYILAQSI